MYSCDLVYLVIKRTPKKAREPARIGGKNARCIATGKTRSAFALVLLVYGKAKQQKQKKNSHRAPPAASGEKTSTFYALLLQSESLGQGQSGSIPDKNA
jgi:hypothetical protein